MSIHKLQRIELFTLFLAITVVGIGAFTRLSDAGLGCPDWPGCYGKWIVKANIAKPALSSLDTNKAMTEMLHRYLAGILALSLVTTTIIRAIYFNNSKLIPKTSIYIILLLITQGLFGMWTVTWKLHPLAVMPHLIGGISISSLICWNYYKNHKRKLYIPTKLKYLIQISLVIIFMQTILGGWTSSNYAALICPDFPTCQGSWLPKMNFNEGFQIPPIGPNYEGGLFSLPARTAIHFSHRVGALISCLLICYTLYYSETNKKLSCPTTISNVRIIFFLTVIQAGLGIANVVLALPLTIAVGHNIVALLIILTLIKTLAQKHNINNSNTLQV